VLQKDKFVPRVVSIFADFATEHIRALSEAQKNA